MTDKRVEFYDTTMRDGAQSIWAMRMTYGAMDAISSELDEGGYSCIELPVNAMNAKMQVRFFQENPWEIARLFKRKITRTKKTQVIMDCLDLLGESDPRAIIREYYRKTAEATGCKRMFYMANTRNELDRYFPWVVPMVREMGLEFQPCICYYPSPRTTDEYYANLTKRIVEQYKPEALWLKDAGGLLSLDRIRTLLPAIQKEAKGTHIDLHTHGMSTYQGLVVVEAMKMGVNGVHTCVPPLASGSSHISIFNAMHNAKALGLKHNITNADALKVVEEKLNRIAKIDGLPVGVPLEYDHGVYSHQIPGGVISNLRSQLEQLKIGHKLDEVLEEVVRIIDDLGNPIMITPASQFIVSQAAVNVATGERYKEVLDAMIETALGVWGWEDAGVPWMKPEIKDRFLSHPNAKKLKERYERRQAVAAEEGSVAKLRASYGMTNASDDDFWLFHIMRGDTETKKIRSPKSYYTGKEPLTLLLTELSKDRDISRLQLRKGNTYFDFRQE